MTTLVVFPLIAPTLDHQQIAVWLKFQGLGIPSVPIGPATNRARQRITLTILYIHNRPRHTISATLPECKAIMSSKVRLRFLNTLDTVTKAVPFWRDHDGRERTRRNLFDWIVLKSRRLLRIPISSRLGWVRR